MRQRIIRLRAEAPAKPAPGAACNGCGLCCMAEPCPAGMLVSRRRRGRCRALRWDGARRIYRCGLVEAPQRWLPLLPAPMARWLARRWIAAQQGCDSDLAPA